jgi:hypothetical protein
MILTMQCLGDDYIVWDKSAEIEFVAPGRSDVYAEFHIEDSFLDELRSATATGEKALRWCHSDVVTEGGEVIARMRKQIYVRRKRRD